ncbi:MAG TPA: hypothetical protein VHP99_17305 [Pyrinomonadaceae bacterium]|nr:hypothetical protein [Pyrinomonadaceae bacterium]
MQFERLVIFLRSRTRAQRIWSAQLAFILITLLFGPLFQPQAIAQALPQKTDSLKNSPEPEGSSTSQPAMRTEEEIEKLKTVVADQQKRIDQLEQMVNDQQKLIEQALHLPTTKAAPRNEIQPATKTETGDVARVPDAPLTSIEPVRQNQPAADSPLTFRLGQVSITPYGFLELTTIIRDKDVGSGVGTNFGGIPFSTTVNGHLSEFRFSAQSSRLGARFDAHHGSTDFLGMVETDFNGFAPGNAPVTTNGLGMRMRLGWVDVRKNKWELLGGQSWSLLTPNRKGTSPIPADIFSTQNTDQSIQVGLTWARDSQFRLIYHANKTVTFAVSLEAAEQYGGGSSGTGEITLPAALASSYNSQLDLGGSTFNVPNLHPDVIAKLAFDPKVGHRDLHFEVAGLLSSFRFFNPQTKTKHGATGGGVLVGINYEAAKNFRLIANGFYSNGGGRWIFGLGPDVIINSDGRPSLVHSASTVTGFEYQANPNNLFDAYYGGAYIYRSSAVDLNGQPIGYGYSGSPLNHNRSLQELTFGYTRTFWRDPNYGALQFISQYSYLTRNPWSVPVGQPSHANLNFVYLSIRYILPGAPPARTGQ